MPDLEQQLAALASEIEWPATPLHLWGGVRLIRTEGSTRWHWQRWGRPLAVAAAALLIVAIALTAYPPSRDAIARWVNLHTIIRRTVDICCPDQKVKVVVELSGTLHHVRADPSRIGVWGHSFGGGAVPYLVQQIAALGWGRSALWMAIGSGAAAADAGSGA